MSLDLTLLEPPYRDPAPIIGRLPVLGAVAVARVDGPRGLTPRLAELIEVAPWTVPCVVLRHGSVTSTVLQQVWELPAQPAFVIGGQGGEPVPPATVLAAVGNRPAPPPSLLVSYLVRRTGSVVLGQTLDHLWAGRARTGERTADRTIRYRLRRLGAYGRHDWGRIRGLVRAKVDGRTLNVEQRAHLVGTEARTLRAWIARYLGTTMKTFRTTAGWEWILESALRRGGFLRAQPVDRPDRREVIPVGA
jgi:hypothetical protein